MPQLLLTLCLLFAAIIAVPCTAFGQEETPYQVQPLIVDPLETPADRELVFATKEAAPFAFRGPDGEWTGISIELLSSIADELDLSYRLEEATLAAMIDGTAEGRFDGAIAAISITPSRETKIDFTFPFYSTGLGIAVNPAIGGGWLRVVRNFFSLEFLGVIGGLIAVLLVAGFAVWLFERRGNPEEFDPSPSRGLGAGFWWAAVTMTTVGYGDKSPKTLGGRMVGLVWMFVGLIIIASFTAAITASLTVGQLSGKVRSISDLSSVAVGVVGESSGAEELADRRITARPFPSIAAGLKALAEERIDTFVHDRPLLLYTVINDYSDRLDVLPETIGREDYAMALRQGSPLREPVNRALLARIRAPNWGRVIKSYLGENE